MSYQYHISNSDRSTSSYAYLAKNLTDLGGSDEVAFGTEDLAFGVVAIHGMC